MSGEEELQEVNNTHIQPPPNDVQYRKQSKDDRNFLQKAGDFLAGNDRNQRHRQQRQQQLQYQQYKADQQIAHQNRMNDMKEMNKMVLDDMKSQHINNINKMKYTHNKILNEQKAEIQDLADEHSKSKVLYQQQIEDGRQHYKELENVLEKLINSNEKQRDNFNKRQEKLRRQLDQQLIEIEKQSFETKQEYQQKVIDIQSKNDAKLKILQDAMQKEQERQQEEIKRIAQQNEETYKTLKSSELKSRFIQIAKLIISQLLQYNEKKKITKEVFKQYVDELTQIQSEERRLTHFELENTDNEALNVVLLGITGHGKSTLACRLAGDRTTQCTKGYFRHSDELESVTQTIQKRTCQGIWNEDERISIIDTPGILDSNNNDRFHTNNLIEFLRGSGGINAFILVKTKIPPRFDKAFQDVLLSLAVLLGDEFWNHVIVVITHQPDLNGFNEYKQELIKIMCKEMDIDESKASLPCIGLDCYTNYKSQIEELLKLIPKQRFDCSELRSPLQRLQAQNKSTKQRFDLLKTDSDSIKTVIVTAYQQYKNLDNLLIETDPNHISDDIDMTSITNEPEDEWKVDIILPPQSEQLPIITSQDNDDDDDEEKKEEMWMEVDMKEYKFIGDLKEEDGEYVVGLMDATTFLSPDGTVKLDKNDEKYEQYIEIFNDADDTDDVYVSIKEIHLKNECGKERIQRIITSIEPET